MRVFIAGGMALRTINMQHSPRLLADPIQEICDKINEIIADF